MEKCQLTPEAVSDLLEICDFINQDNPEAADGVEDSVLRACDFLAGSPLAGRVRKDLTSLPLRFSVVQPYSMYLIVYDPEKKPLQIIRILHGARNLPSVLNVMLLWAHRIRSRVILTRFSARLLFLPIG
jgi:toxin ParE1/3/4